MFFSPSIFQACFFYKSSKSVGNSAHTLCTLAVNYSANPVRQATRSHATYTTTTQTTTLLICSISLSVYLSSPISALRYSLSLVSLVVRLYALALRAERARVTARARRARSTHNARSAERPRPSQRGQRAVIVTAVVSLVSHDAQQRAHSQRPAPQRTHTAH